MKYCQSILGRDKGDQNSAIKTSFFTKANLWHVDHIELYQNFHFGL